MSKSIRSIVACFAMVFIANCGGGGGGGSGGSSTPPPPVVTPATVTIVSTTPSGTNVSVTTTPVLNFTVTNGSYASHSADWKCGGNTVTFTSAVVGTTSGTITLTPTSVIPLGATCQINWSVAGTPAGNTAATVTQTYTTKSTMSYTDKVYVTYIGGYPYSVSKTGVTPVTNKTSFTTGFFPIFNCGFYEIPIETGIIPAKCTVAVDNLRRTFAINPITQELNLYTGSYVFDETKFHDVAWGTTFPYGASVGRFGEYAEIADGIYWGPALSDQKLRFSPKTANGYDFSTISVVATGTGADFFKYIFKYSF